MELRHFRVEESPDRAAIVWIDVSGRPVNVFWEPVLDELETLIDRFEALSATDRVLFRSAKPTGFIVGADLKRIASLDSDADADEFLSRGQELFDRLARLAATTVAVIEGPCLGGGLEFALACRHRFARDDPKTQLGLPETKLGLLPGWGGTQRLPECVGLRRALQMIVSGESVDGTTAFQWGLVDAVADSASFEEAAAEYAARGTWRGSAPSGRKGSIVRSLEGTAPARWWTYAALRRNSGGTLTQAQTAAWDAVVRGWRRSYAEGLFAERQHFRQLLKTPRCRDALNRFLSPGSS